MDLALLVKAFIFGVVVVVTVMSVVIPLLSAAATGKCFGDYPARIAALMKPEALRYNRKGRALRGNRAAGGRRSWYPFSHDPGHS